MKVVEALDRLLAALKTMGRALILLRERSFDAATATSPGDYDFLAPDGSFDEVLRIWNDTVLETEASCLVHFSKPEKRHIVLFDPVEDRKIDVDLWREHRIDVPARGGRSTRVLRYSSLAPRCTIEGEVLRMPGWLELTVYLCHLFEKKKDLGSDGVRDRLLHYSRIDLQGSGCPPEHVEALRAALDGLRDGRTGAEAAARAGTEVLDRLGMIREKPSSLEGARWWWQKRSRSIARRLGAGPAIVVQGPDGAGKTTIIDAVLRGETAGGRKLQPVVFKGLYRHSIFRLLYKSVRKIRRLRRPDEPKEVVEVALAPFLFAGALINYRLGQVVSGRGRARVFDRYFPDLLVTNRKDAGSSLELTRSYRLLARWIPRVSCAVLLTVRPEVLLQRKAEMTAENAMRYTRLMAAHYVRRPPTDLLILRTDVALERTVGVLRAVLEGRA